jgi:hypothetical protein
MKLIFCPKCQDVVRLHNEKRSCSCGLVWGFYIDEVKAIISQKSIPLGFNNSSFAFALKNRRKDGLGFRFDAFVIPHESPTITKQR